MTNREKIKAVLNPRANQIRILGNWVEIEIHKSGINFSCGLEWWNAEYKEPSSSEVPDLSEIPTGSTTKNDCETCIHNKGVLECDMYGCKYEPTTKKDLAVDAVSRQAINGYIDYILSHGMGKKKSFEFIKKFVANLPSVTLQLSSELDKNSQKLEKDFGESDCISRADVNQVIEDYMDEQYHVLSDRTRERAFGARVVMARINELNPVTPIRPKGHWIPIYQGDEIIDYRCSECEFGNTFGRGTFGMDFCPRCGSDNSNPSDAKAIREALPRIEEEVVIQETEAVESGKAIAIEREKLEAWMTYGNVN